MRLPNDRTGTSLLALGLCLALSACGGAGGQLASAPMAPAANGPAADYPIVIGDPYTVNGVTYTPSDTLNYDEVGYATVDASLGAGVAGAHHTLPLPSYVEVTSLETGRTILVRLTERGPMEGNALVALSPAAVAQLGAGANTPVRVRRVNPPEQERAMLRAGTEAPVRMDTPMSLVNVLRRKLPGADAQPVETASAAPRAAPVPVEGPPPQGDANPSAAFADARQAAPVPAPTPVPSPSTSAGLALPPLATVQTPPTQPEVAAKTATAAAVPAVPKSENAPVAAAQPAKAANLFVQAGAFSTRERAERVAGVVKGEVSQSGRYYRVRTGPFVSPAEAEASLAKVKAAGYKDARIFAGG